MKSIAMIFLRNEYQKNRALWAASFQAALNKIMHRKLHLTV